MLTRQVFEGLQRVGHKHHAVGVTASGNVVGNHLRVADHSHGAPLVESLRRKTVAVEGVALQCVEDAAFGAVAAVGGHYRMLPINVV